MRLPPLLLLLAPLYLFGASSTTIECGGSNPCDPGGTTSESTQEVPAVGYFVDCANGGGANGSNSNNGTSYLTPWGTLGKVNSDVSILGSDVHIKGTCGDQVLTVDWPSSGVNPIYIGAYHVSGGVAYQRCTDGDPCESIEMPQINGTYTASCSQSLGAAAPAHCPFVCQASAANCLVADFGSPVPAGQFSALLTISSDYVVVQDLLITESSGIGVGLDGVDDITLDNVKVDITASLSVFPKNTQYLKVIRSEFARAAIGSSRGDQLYAGGPHAISLQTSIPSYALFEDNYFHDIFGEGINCRTSSFCIVRGNRVENFKNIGIYIDNASDMLVENNEVFGKTTTSTAPGGGWNASGVGIGVAVEETSNPNYNTVRNVVRNNRIANVITCFNINVFPAREAAGWKTGGQIIGNTCLAYTSRAVNINDPVANIDSWEIANNIFDQPNNGGASRCSSPGSPASFHHNAWDVAPSDTDCRGTGDVAGASGVSTTFSWTTAGQGNYPTAADWAITHGSAKVAHNAGSAMTSSMVNTSVQFLQFGDLIGTQAGGGNCSPGSASWNQQLALGFTCAARVAPIDIGSEPD